MTTMERAWAAVEKIKQVCGEKIVAQSCVMDGLPDVLHGLGRSGRYAECCVEVGTLRGLSAVVLAHFCHNVITIDVERQPELGAVLACCSREIQNRIAPILVPDNDAKVLLLNRLKFDFAFIDGGHTEAQVAIDFGAMRKCGEVLFHDYPKSGSGACGVGFLLDNLHEGDLEVRAPFAWWRATP